MYKLINKIGIDRIAHYGVGSFVAAMIIYSLCWTTLATIIINSLFLPFCLALYKEKRDQALGGKFDKWDIIATELGAIMTLGLFLLRFITV